MRYVKIGGDRIFAEYQKLETTPIASEMRIDVGYLVPNSKSEAYDVYSLSENNKVVKLTDTVVYEATISGMNSDYTWDGRESKTITTRMSHNEAEKLFDNGTIWSILMDTQRSVFIGKNASAVTENYIEEYDNSEFVIAGPITDYRDGTVDIKMGKPTDLETVLEMMYGGDSI